MEFLKKEPIAVVGLVVTLILGLLSSPLILDWYAGPKLSAIINYSHADDGRCIPQLLTLSNKGNEPATNVRVQFSTDYFTKRGDIKAYYSGDEAFYKIEKNVEYTAGNNYVLIPSMLPGQSQEFVFVEQFDVPGIQDKRLSLLSKKDPSVLNFPNIDLVTSNEGQVKLVTESNDCV